MDDNNNDLGDARYYALQTGVVVDRNDPAKLGRVKVRIPGLCDNPSTGWAAPLGMPGSGTKQRGMKWVPPLNAEVGVLFKGGAPDRPYYLAGEWGDPQGESEMPEDCKDLPADQAPDVHCIETDRYKITIDDRTSETNEASPSLTITDKVSGDMIQLDGAAKTGPGIYIKATAGLVIDVDGIFAVRSNRCVINGRTQAEGSQSW